MMDVAGTHLFPHGKHLCFLLPGGPFLGSRKLFFVDGGLSLLPASRDPSSPFSLKSFAVLTLLFCVCKLYSVAWSCPALCDPMDCSPLGSCVCGILQARTLEWVAISSSKGLPQLGMEPVCPALAGGFFTGEPSGKSYTSIYLSPNSLHCLH